MEVKTNFVAKPKDLADELSVPESVAQTEKTNSSEKSRLRTAATLTISRNNKTHF